jgi:hypothetical protein
VQRRESLPASDPPAHDPRREYTDPELDEDHGRDAGAATDSDAAVTGPALLVG